MLPVKQYEPDEDYKNEEYESSHDCEEEDLTFEVETSFLNLIHFRTRGGVIRDPALARRRRTPDQGVSLYYKEGGGGFSLFCYLGFQDREGC